MKSNRIFNVIALDPETREKDLLGSWVFDQEWGVTDVKGVGEYQEMLEEIADDINDLDHLEALMDRQTDQIQMSSHGRDDFDNGDLPDPVDESEPAPTKAKLTLVGDDELSRRRALKTGPQKNSPQPGPRIIERDNPLFLIALKAHLREYFDLEIEERGN